jgi:GPH family glycoside/pentoside/hexuronide:cation symporter
LALANTCFLFFLFQQLTDRAALDAAVVGTLLMVAKGWDAFTDPMVGRWTDRLAHRGVSRRLWLLWGAPVFGLATALLWVPCPLPEVARPLWHLGALLLYGTSYTAVVVPYGTLTPLLTEDYDERTRLGETRMLWSMMGGITAGFLMPGLAGALGGWAGQGPLRDGWSVAGTLLGVASALSLLLCAWGTRPTLEGNAEEALKPWSRVWKEGPFRRVVVLFVLCWSAIAVVSALVPYYAHHVMGAPQRADVIFAAIQLGALFSVPAVAALAVRHDKARVLGWAVALWSLSMVVLGLWMPAPLGWVMLLATVAGPGVAAAHVLPWSMLPDAIEMEGAASGRANAGMYYGAMTFAEKLATAGAMMVMGAVLQWQGYVAGGGVQPASAVAAIGWLIAGGVALPLALAAGAALRYPPLTRNQWKQLRDLQGGPT